MKNWFYRNDIWLLVGGWVLVVFPAILFVGMTVMVARTELQDYRKTLRKSDAHAMREVGRVATCLERTGSSAAERAALRNACLFEQLPAFDTSQGIARALTGLETEGGSFTKAQVATIREALARGKGQIEGLRQHRQASIERYCEALRWVAYLSSWKCVPDLESVDDGPLLEAEARLASSVVLLR
jgi:hypothetical protein